MTPATQKLVDAAKQVRSKFGWHEATAENDDLMCEWCRGVASTNPDSVDHKDFCPMTELDAALSALAQEQAPMKAKSPEKRCGFSCYDEWYLKSDADPYISELEARCGIGAQVAALPELRFVVSEEPLTCEEMDILESQTKMLRAALPERPKV